MKKTTFAIICIFAGLQTAFSQIVYNDSIFALDRVPVEWNRPAGIHLSEFDGISLIGPGTWLKIDMSNMTSISGSNGCVNLYDADTGTYSTLFVECIYNRSDGNAKTDITPLADSHLDRLRPVSFKWKKTRNKIADGAVDLTDGVKYGLIAQEVQQVYPELVRHDDFGNLTVNYIGLIPVLIKSLQEIETDIERQSSEIDILLQELALLKNNTSTLNPQQP
ncbi:MAG: tail fiber domain-containing protein [Paramuribaculum sp.]|nr:tail fiber domain-containing protein [Paramuribaculum sp.]